MAKIIPDSYDRHVEELKLGSKELSLVRKAESFLEGEDLMIVCDLFGFPSMEEHDHLTMAIIQPNKKITFVKPLPLATLSPSLINPFVATALQGLRSKIIDTLKNHRLLRNSNEEEIFEVEVVYYLPDISGVQEEDYIPEVRSQFIINNRRDFENFLKRYKNKGNDNCFTELELNAIFQIMCPEYTIPSLNPVLNNESQNDENVSFEDIEINPNEFFVRSWRLEPEQITYASNIRQGNWLFLSCAGSGKSVILLSRVITLARRFPEKKFLITFFNKSLKGYYQWRLECAGVNTTNVYCVHIHSLFKTIISQAGEFHRNRRDYEENLRALEASVERIIGSGRNKLFFKGIFIDEVQDFTQRWYKILYSLQENKNSGYFTLAGDITQDIKGRVISGKTPWRVPHDQRYPIYRGRTRHFKKNFRNHKEINEYAKSFNKLSNKWAVENEIQLEEEDFLYGESNKEEGFGVEVFDLVDLQEEVERVIQEVKKLHEDYQVGYSDILVCYPYRQQNSLRYFIENCLLDAFEHHNIDAATPQSFDAEERQYWQYSLRSGVTCANIDQVKGLDYRAVIICGLHSYKAKKAADTNQKKLQSLKALYTAMTRAREYLGVLLTGSQDDFFNSFCLKAKEEMDND